MGCSQIWFHSSQMNNLVRTFNHQNEDVEELKEMQLKLTGWKAETTYS